MGKNSQLIGLNDRLTAEIVKSRDPLCKLNLTGCSRYTTDTMHVFGRRNFATRWDTRAIFGGCRECHTFIDTHPEQKKMKFTLLMGKSLYDELEQKSNKVCKLSTSDLKEITKSLHKQYEQTKI